MLLIVGLPLLIAAVVVGFVVCCLVMQKKQKRREAQLEADSVPLEPAICESLENSEVQRNNEATPYHGVMDVQPLPPAYTTSHLPPPPYKEN